MPKCVCPKESMITLEVYRPTKVMITILKYSRRVLTAILFWFTVVMSQDNISSFCQKTH